MTKRLFAIVLAAVLAITMFTFPTFADEIKATANLGKDGTKLILTFNKGSDVSANRVVLNFFVGENTTPIESVPITDMSTRSYTYQTTTGGTYHAQVVYYNGSQILQSPESGTQTIPITTNGNNMTVSYGENGIELSWSKVTNATRYRIDFTLKNGLGADSIYVDNLFENNGKIIYTVRESQVSYSNISNIRIYSYVNGWNNNSPCASCTISYSSGSGSGSGSSSNTGLLTGGNVTAKIENGYIVGTINDYRFGVYRYGIANGSSFPQYSYPTSNRSFSVPISNTYYGMYIVVQGAAYNSTSDSDWTTIGDIRYNYSYGGNSSSGNVSLNNYNGALVLSWAPVTGATSYVIQYRGNNINSGSQTVNANTTYWTVPFASVTNAFTIDVFATKSDGSSVYVGTTGSNYGNNFNPYYPSYGQSSGGVVTKGNNCTVTSYANYANIQWVSTGASQYVVAVYTDGDTRGNTQFVYNGLTYTQIPISNNYNYNIAIFDYNNSYTPIATASVKAQATSLDNITSVKKTTIKNLKVTPLNSYTTSISWDKVNGTEFYAVLYGLLNGGAGEELPVYHGDTSVTIPFGSNTAYQVTVYAVSSSGKRTQVGYVYNVPGTTADGNNAGKDYPSNLTAKSSNKKIRLTWKEAENASYYTIYYKRASSSTWNKIDQRINKTAVNISGLTNEVEYNFKVVPNKGSESGIVTIAPSTTSRTVTAKDPSSSSSSDDGDINLDDEELTVTSVSSTSAGKIKVTWSNVGAPSYKIYVAEGTSSSYKACGTYTGTSATISTFGTGSKATSFKSGKTYKVRVVRTDYTGSIKDALKACPYKTVTVK